MSRKYAIIGATANSSPTPDTFLVSGDFTSVFKGKHYRQIASPHALSDYHLSPLTPPAGYQLIEACTFDVIGTTNANGRYTVFTKTSTTESSEYNSGTNRTTIRVNETIATTLGSGGFITNVSTYLIGTWPTGSLLVPNGVALIKGYNGDDYPIDYIGRYVNGYGEAYAQNLQDLLQNFAAATAPTSPFIGQIWFDTTASILKVWNGSTWLTPGAGVFAPVDSYRHTQTTTSTSWTVAHGLGLSFPFIAHVSCFSNEVGGLKAILPSDISFDNANQLTVTFSSGKTGYVLVRP